MVYQEVNNGIENNIHFPQIPLINYVTDVEHEEDLGCDLLDQLMMSYCMLHWLVKWWRELFFHMFSWLLNNTNVLHKKFGVKAVAHDVFLEHIVQYLLNESMGNATTKVIRKRCAEISNACLFEGHHYPVHIPKCSGSKIGSKKCSACNLGKKELKATGCTSLLKCKLTSYPCDICKVPLCASKHITN